MRAYAVVGAGYGDEGKGLATDYIAGRLMDSGALPLVVRTNGGAQAAHTVVLPDGRRHVFSHFGSGSLRGVRTHLAGNFVSNPILFQQELVRLNALGVTPSVSAAPTGRLATPWDMMLNQFSEVMRGDGRHGSCGQGFGEAIERDSRGYPLSVGDIAEPGFADKLRRIVQDWVPARFAELSAASPGGWDRYMATNPGFGDVHKLFASEAIMDGFLSDARAYLNAVTLQSTRYLGLSGADALIFEGAQGLMLDQEYGAFPHVTRSLTGLYGMLPALEAIDGIEALHVTYMTRSYVTRHGAGPLMAEQDISDFAAVVDPTNQPNQWQGALRFAPLDTNVLMDAIAWDMTEASEIGLKVTATLGVSCLDQISDEGARVTLAGAEVRLRRDELAAAVAREVGLELGLTSRGPTASDVSWHATAFA